MSMLNQVTDGLFRTISVITVNILGGLEDFFFFAPLIDEGNIVFF